MVIGYGFVYRTEKVMGIGGCSGLGLWCEVGFWIPFSMVVKV